MEKENNLTFIEPKAGELDATDIKILTCLQDNSRLTTKELAAKVHLSTTPVFERQKRLEREGYPSSSASSPADSSTPASPSRAR